MKKLIRTLIVTGLFLTTLIAISVLLYIAKLPYLSPGNFISPTTAAISGVLLSRSEKVKSFINNAA